ncbi:MAG: hypothetical protein M1819_005605 [Sarea resinae]|nr:MAG: hypothetical protein M1819_005605 [Sarea resinae]
MDASTPPQAQDDYPVAFKHSPGHRAVFPPPPSRSPSPVRERKAEPDRPTGSRFEQMTRVSMGLDPYIPIGGNPIFSKTASYNDPDFFKPLIHYDADGHEIPMHYRERGENAAVPGSTPAATLTGVTESKEETNAKDHNARGNSSQEDFDPNLDPRLRGIQAWAGSGTPPHHHSQPARKAESEPTPTFDYQTIKTPEEMAPPRSGPPDINEVKHQETLFRLSMAVESVLLTFGDRMVDIHGEASRYSKRRILDVVNNLRNDIDDLIIAVEKWAEPGQVVDQRGEQIDEVLANPQRTRSAKLSLIRHMLRHLPALPPHYVHSFATMSTALDPIAKDIATWAQVAHSVVTERNRVVVYGPVRPPHGPASAAAAEEAADKHKTEEDAKIPAKLSHPFDRPKTPQPLELPHWKYTFRHYEPNLKVLTPAEISFFEHVSEVLTALDTETNTLAELIKEEGLRVKRGARAIKNWEAWCERVWREQELSNLTREYEGLGGGDGQSDGQTHGAEGRGGGQSEEGGMSLKN